MPKFNLEQLYQNLGQWDHETKDELWKQWLWGCDCNARPLESCCDMNEMHVVGVLICLAESKHPVKEYNLPISVDSMSGPCIIHLYPDTNVCALSLRETLDQIECLQLNWGPTLAESGYCHSSNTLRALMARLGEIIGYAYPIQDGKGIVLDDPQHVTPLPSSPFGIISRKSLRQVLCILLALFRSHHIISNAEEIVDVSEKAEKEVIQTLRQHHLEASQDDFALIQQMVFLAPGQRLAYRTLFTGLYNSVSQVIYFHHPRFARQAQLELARIPESAIHMLPPIMQLLPEITVIYDDDSRIPGITFGKMAADPKFKWVWLISCGVPFLIDVEHSRILGHCRLGPLVAHYLLATHTSISSSVCANNNNNDHSTTHSTNNTSTSLITMNTPFSHVQLI